MIKKKYSIYTTPENSFEQMCRSLLSQIGNRDDVLKIVYFGTPPNNEEYLSQLDVLRQCTNAYFPERSPLISYVAQMPHIGSLNAEVVSLDSAEDVTIRYGENYRILENGICRELVTGGILPPDIFAPISVQSNVVFSRIEEILVLENFPLNSIVRQWNYIENITRIDSDRQRYQIFNDSRSHFYTRADWSLGYPSATGIGTQYGGVMVEIIAFAGNGLVNRALDNSMQVAAHNYSQDVLFGAASPDFRKHTTPKFERARVIGLPDRQTVFISGTAAIRGESSLYLDDVTEQVRATMENIDYLISAANYPEGAASREYKILRIYVKNPAQMEIVCNYMNTHYPETEKIYVCADICRDELLVEIEGIAEINFEVLLS